MDDVVWLYIVVMINTLLVTVCIGVLMKVSSRLAELEQATKDVPLRIMEEAHSDKPDLSSEEFDEEVVLADVVEQWGDGDNWYEGMV